MTLIDLVITFTMGECMTPGPRFTHPLATQIFWSGSWGIYCHLAAATSSGSTLWWTASMILTDRTVESLRVLAALYLGFQAWSFGSFVHCSGLRERLLPPVSAIDLSGSFFRRCYSYRHATCWWWRACWCLPSARSLTGTGEFHDDRGCKDGAEFFCHTWPNQEYC